LPRLSLKQGVAPQFIQQNPNSISSLFFENIAAQEVTRFAEIGTRDALFMYCLQSVSALQSMNAPPKAHMKGDTHEHAYQEH
jgi:hypothetical protein